MKLIAEGGALAGQEVAVQRAQAVIGRDAASDIVLAEQNVSRQHARIHYMSGAPGAAAAWYVIDLGTMNGTFLNGSRLPANQPRPLKPGDRVSIGTSVLIVRDLNPPAQAGMERGPLMRLPTAARVMAAILYVGAMVAIVALLVTLLRPVPQVEDAALPTAENPLDMLTTVIPTGLPEELSEPIDVLKTALPTDAQDPLNSILTSLPLPGTPSP